MKVSYLILAHNNYLHLERLIDELKTGTAGFIYTWISDLSYPRSYWTSRTCILSKSASEYIGVAIR